MWWVWAASALGACPRAAEEVVARAATDVLQAFEQVDDDALVAARTRLDSALPCPSGPMAPSTAVDVHRAYGVVYFIEGDAAASRRAWTAVRTLDPSWRPSEALAPPGHAIRTLFDEGNPTHQTVTVEVAPPGGWQVDGAPSSSVPEHAAFVLQGLDADGAVVLSGYYLSPSAIPLADVRAFAALPRVPESRRRVRRIGTIAAGAGLLTAGTFATVAQVQAAGLEGRPYSEVEATKRRARRYGVVAGITGVTALVGGVVVWAVPW